jgi:hypothetical protein
MAAPANLRTWSRSRRCWWRTSAGAATGSPASCVPGGTGCGPMGRWPTWPHATSSSSCTSAGGSSCRLAGVGVPTGCTTGSWSRNPWIGLRSRVNSRSWYRWSCTRSVPIQCATGFQDTPGPRALSRLPRRGGGEPGTGMPAPADGASASDIGAAPPDLGRRASEGSLGAHTPRLASPTRQTPQPMTVPA